MLYRGQRIDKKQTSVIEQSRDPVFDQTFEFNLFNFFQSTNPLDNVAFETDFYISTETSSTSLNSKIASCIQFVILIMDLDQIEKNDVIGKVELNTQNHQKRLFTYQLQQNYNFNDKNSDKDNGNQNKNFQLKDNWFDVFYQPNFPILCSFQINSF
jgi:hypothetical protein